jgi:RNA polymerase subunit RPABC4/transcription elongation factor Spt4
LADESVVYECRNCGTTLDERQDTCTACGADDIARYDLE